MPPKKKATGNGFWTFFTEFKRTHNSEDKDDIMKLADKVWRSMTEEEKRKYSGKKITREPKEVPLTNLQKEELEEANRKAAMVEQISNELQIARKYKNLSKVEFFLIHINHLCVDHQNKRTYPCEIGISRFSLDDGVSDVYHSLVESGRLPQGYLGEAKLVSDQTHCLPWDEHKDNQERVFRDIMTFLQAKSRDSRELPKLYAIKENEMELVKNTLQTWCDMFGEEVEIEVYNAQLLYSLLLKNIKGEETVSSDGVSYHHFQRDIHQFAQGICCEYHEQSGSPVYCSLSIAVRFAFIICENCSPPLGIRLLPGYHVPASRSSRIEAKNATSSKVNNIRIDDDAISTDAISTVRDDSSDVETLVSLGKSTVFVEETESSIGVPEYDDFVTITRKRRPTTGNSTHSQPSGRNGFMKNEVKPPVISVASTISSEDLSSYHNVNNDDEEEESSIAFVPTSNDSGASRTGSSGFSRKPAALPSRMNRSLANLTMSQDMSGKDQWPPLGVGRGTRSRGRGSTLPKRGRGTPFQRN